MLHSWQGALRKLKKLLRERGIDLRGARAKRWCSLSFEGWQFEFYFEAGHFDLSALDHEMANVEVHLPGFLLAELHIERDRQLRGVAMPCVSALLVDAPETFLDPILPPGEVR